MNDLRLARGFHALVDIRRNRLRDLEKGMSGPKGANCGRPNGKTKIRHGQRREEKSKDVKTTKTFCSTRGGELVRSVSGADIQDTGRDPELSKTADGVTNCEPEFLHDALPSSMDSRSDGGRRSSQLRGWLDTLTRGAPQEQRDGLHAGAFRL